MEERFEHQLLDSYLEPRLQRIERALREYLPATDKKPATLVEAMRYALLSGGKRLRPVLCIASAEACGAEMETVLPTACALEMIHAFSLTHDDLPALDNDTLRRGKPTCHVQFGEAVALLAGDALFAKAFEMIAQQSRLSPPGRVIQVLALVSHAVGTNGMVGGQVEDMHAESGAPTPDDLEYIHTHKTGSLIRASVLAGGALAGAEKESLVSLDNYGKFIGHAFQIIDDILNETGDPERLGKAVGSDRKRQKATYPRLFGLEKSQETADNYITKAVNALQDFGAEADPLRWLAQYVSKRDH